MTWESSRSGGDGWSRLSPGRSYTEARREGRSRLRGRSRGHGRRSRGRGEGPRRNGSTIHKVVVRRQYSPRGKGYRRTRRGVRDYGCPSTVTGTSRYRSPRVSSGDMGTPGPGRTVVPAEHQSTLLLRLHDPPETDPLSVPVRTGVYGCRFHTTFRPGHPVPGQSVTARS